MVDYSNPENVKALADRVPAIDKLRAHLGEWTIDYNDLAPVRKSIAEGDEENLKQTAEQAKFETDIQIPMRDGYHNPARVFRPHNPIPESPLIVLVHGGGFFVAERSMLMPTARALAQLFSATVITITYRLTPENPFPITANDAWDNLTWIAANATSFGADPSAGFIVGGTSAGGHLVSVIVQKSVTDNLTPPVTGMWMCAPTLLVPELVPEKHRHLYLAREQCRDAPGLQTEEMDQIRRLLQPDIKSPMYCPLNAPDAHVGMPKTYIQVCGLDPVRDDALIYEALLRENGVETRLDAYTGAPHLYWFNVALEEPARGCYVDILRAFTWLLGKEKNEEEIEKAVPLFKQ